MNDTDSLPLTFREAEVRQILALLDAGESCTLVGIGSVGKSNLLRFLLRRDVHEAYSAQAAAGWLFAYIDINKLLKPSAWSLWELMLHQLVLALKDRGCDAAAVAYVDDLHRQATLPATRPLALRYLDRAIWSICRELGLRLVFLVDEFDQLCRLVPPRAFTALRAIRDDHKGRLGYVVATRSEWQRLSQERDDLEAFEELVSPNTVWLGPYSEADGRYMLQRLQNRRQVMLADDIVEALLRAAGGHPGLLRAGFRTAVSRPGDLPAALSETEAVRQECARIWSSLASDEQRVLVRLTAGSAVPETQGHVMERLALKRMVGGPWSPGRQIFSPLLAQYIREQQPVVGARIFIDHGARKVWVDGSPVEGLARLEYDLLAYLEQHRGKVCARDEIAQHLYPHDMALTGEGVSEARLDSVTKRLRKCIEPDPDRPRFVVTVRGHGLRLDDGDVEK